MKNFNQNAVSARTSKTNRIIKIFHLAQTVGQILILLICATLAFVNRNLFNQNQRFAISLSLIFVCLQFSLLQTESEQPKRWQLINHYIETIAICYTLPISLSLLTKLLNYYHLINGTFWMLSVTFYSLIMYIPMAKLALSRVNNNWGRILLLMFVVYDEIIWTASNIAGHLRYNKVLLQINNSGLSGTPVLIIITVLVMSCWKIQKPHFVYSRNDSILFSSLITLLLVGVLLLIAMPHFDYVISIADTLNYYFDQINLGVIGSAIRTGIAEEWLMRFMVIALLAQIFQSSKYRIYLIVLFDGLLFGFWHITNIAYQTPLATLRQMLEISGWGLVIAAIYLYTHSLLLTMTYHGLYDFILFLFQGGISEYGNTVKSAVQPTMMDWQGTILRVTIYAAIALVIIWTKRRQEVIAKNLLQM
ncbi:CPBP family intramembrane glutamic endopeptidase [Lactobacillus rizhaonensis]|uniref:CPBP family intramembrane glutamic endopeptidase n=1 Tax=Lactobacillus rizhaonensis TaxID=3082863 RepID=UPI0030C74432